ncbi:MAG: phosphocholine cytidylyltransferase family protein [Angelakisella sp.]|nr:phosphocholine cytidylyltransferase family protein [Angelakisella sp.]
MKALLFNSGMGSRMGKLTADKPKSMCPIGNGYTIISWQLELLRRCGVTDVIITTGYRALQLEEHIRSCGEGMNLTFVHNPDYDKTNYIYSMFLAREYLDDDIISLHGDLVMEQQVMESLLSTSDSCVVVDSTLPLPEKDFKAKLKDSKVSAIGIEFFGEGCVACQPAYKWHKKDIAQFLDSVEQFCSNGQTKVYAENAFNAISNEITLMPLEVKGRLCSEIDNIEDLKHVSNRFLECME